MQNSKDLLIFIWGCNDFAHLMFDLLKNTSIKVIGFIDDEGKKNSTFCHKPVYDLKKIQENSVWHHIPIVIAVSHHMILKRPILRLKNIHEFKEKIQVALKYNLTNPLLHPAALTDFIPLDYSRKTLLFGLQGSGNVIFSHLFQEIAKKNWFLFLPFKKATYFWQLMCREYMNLTHEVIGNMLHLQGGHNVHAVAWKIGTSHFNCQFSSEPVSVYSFNTQEHRFALVSMYHQIPSKTLLKKLNAEGFKLFFVIRNPLDMILSGINKSGGLNKNTGEIDWDIFQSTANWVIDQLNIWHSSLSYFKILRYENLLLHPIKTIQYMMQQVKALPSTRFAKKIWKKLGFKQLPNAFKNHYWQGGEGKWQQYFKHEHLQFLKLNDIENVLEKYGYTEILVLFRANLDKANMHLSFINSAKRCYYRDENYPTLQFLQEQHGEENCAISGPFYLVGKNKELLLQLKKSFNHSYLEKIALAGAHEDYRLN